MVDLQHTGTSKRVRFPAPYKADASSSTGTGRPAIGSGRGTTSSQPAKGAGAGRGIGGVSTTTQSPRGTTISQRSADQLRDRRKASVASRTISRDDILNRYRGSQDTRNAAAPSQRVTGPASVRAPKLADGRSLSNRSERGLDRKDSKGKDLRSQRDFGRKVVSSQVRGEASPKAYGRGIEQRAKALGLDARKQQRLKGAAGAAAGTGAISGVVQPIGSVGSYAAGLHASHFNNGYYYGQSYVGWCSSYYWNTSAFSFCWAPFAYVNSCWWNSYWSCGGYWNAGFCPSFYWYGPFIRPRYSIVYPIYETQYVEVAQPAPVEEVWVEEEPVVEGEGGVVFIPPPPARENSAKQRSLGRVAHHYMGLGDEAFSGGRYGDAAHYYAKSVEFSPDEGVLYLVLSDALFATGDYRYAAFALRKALELDPSVLAHIVDKRSFYADAGDFDRQLALLELYLKDHFLDEDARLVLAANYLFGGRPAAAVDLLEDPFSAEVTASPAGKALLDAARAIQYGAPAPVGQAADPVVVPDGVPFGPDEDI